ncbi:hypothetical protein [Brucella intermedia]|uniref:hypothetical protein n=1 Tax=Brucella intermedia TaxID=94625 RepID=UPI00224AEEFC|nr:hypothetical protein [Brucella intermedia]
MMGLSTYSTEDLIKELQVRDFRAIHRDRIRTCSAQSDILKEHVRFFGPAEQRKGEYEHFMRKQLGQELGNFLADRLPITEHPDDYRVYYRMDCTIIGPRISADDPEYIFRPRDF